MVVQKANKHKYRKLHSGPGLSFRGGGGVVTPTETNAHGDALRFMAMGPSLLQRVGTWRLAVGGWWRLVAVGGWRLVVPGGCPQGLSLTAGKKNAFLRTALFRLHRVHMHLPCGDETTRTSGTYRMRPVRLDPRLKGVCHKG